MPVSALGGSTQHFRAYGKRRTNVINRRQPLGGWDASPVAAAVPSRSTSSDDSSGSSSEDDTPAAAVLKKVAPARSSAASRQPAFEIVLDAVARPTASRPSQPVARSSIDKENPPPPLRALNGPGAGKGKAKVAETDEHTDVEDAEKPGPLKARARPALVKNVYGARRTTRTTLQSSSSSEDEAVVAPPARRNLVVRSSGSSGVSRRIVAPKRAPVLDSTDESDVDGEDSEELVEDRPSPALADEASSAAASSDEDTNATTAAALPRPPPSRTGRFPPQLRTLQPLLLDPTLFSFSSFVARPPPPFATTPAPWRKIGEASYSEVFATTDEHGRDTVVKIIPVASPTCPRARSPKDVELPFMSSWDAVAREIEVCETMGGGGDGGEGGVEGFVRFKGAFLVQGAYPSELLAAWDAFKRAQRPPSDEQIRPDVLPSTQLYALLLLENAGTALETYRLRSWVEAAAVLAQVVDALGRAEEACGFEHRDLHWGNILLQPVPATASSASSALRSRLASLSLSDPSNPGTPPRAPFSPRTLLDPAVAGLRATLIDFTLSRCAPRPSPTSSGRVLFDAFEDEELFEGEGDYQFEVYRMMCGLVHRGNHGEGWEGEERRTNVLWLHYLADKLLHSSRLRPPPPVPAPAPGLTTACASPARAVPSPLRVRRPLTRRMSMALPLSAAGLGSPLARQYKPRARTLPAALASAANQDAQRMGERAAYDALLRAERALGGAVGALRLSGGGRAGKSGKRVAQGREFEGAREFANWWLGA